MKFSVVTLLFAASISAQPPTRPPTPESHFGHPIGVDRELLDWDKVVSYFQALAKTNDKIRVEELGKTAEGRPFIAATISSAATLRNLDHYREIQAKLADPRRTTPEESARLAAEGKTVVLITCSIHANEVASTHSAIQFVYNLLTEDKPKFRAILDNVIILLVPSQNPDGLDIVTRWYRRTLGTPYEGTSPPELYHKYVGHDNNRDWYIFSQPETRLTVSRLLNAWHPQIVYDVHQQGSYASRMFVPPWLNPIDPNVDATLAQEGNYLGLGVAADLTAAGKKGVVTNALYDFWSPARHYMAYHAGVRILSEAASASLASPLTVRPDQIQATGLGYNPRERSWNYLQPWEGGTWRIGDIVDYQLIAFESLLYEAALRRVDLLRNFYGVGQREVARMSPYAFVISRAQIDPGSARKMLELLSFGEVEIERASDAFDAGGKRYPEGSYIIRMQQPYSSYAKTLLERQHYPDLRLYPGGPPQQPYDVTAQTLPLLMGVETDTVDAPFTVASSLAKSFEFERNVPTPIGALAASDSDTWRAVNKIWSGGAPVFRGVATGDFFAQLPQTIESVKIPRPRIALYRSYVPAIDEGWTRWLLEDFGFAYQNVLNPDIDAGNLRQRFDVIVFPDQPASQMANGFVAGSMPREYTGGLSKKAASNLKSFAEQGGTLVFLNHSANYAVEQLHLDPKSVTAGVSNRDFYSPGSLLNVALDTHDPIAYGLPESIAIWSEDSPAWEVASKSKDRVVARYTGDHVLASGWLLGESYLAGRAALVEVPLGQGRAVLFGMRPQYRAHSYQAFKLFFNSLVLSSAIPSHDR
jgi:Zinc carboxypeptidase